MTSEHKLFDHRKKECVSMFASSTINTPTKVSVLLCQTRRRFRVVIALPLLLLSGRLLGSVAFGIDCDLLPVRLSRSSDAAITAAFLCGLPFLLMLASG